MRVILWALAGAAIALVLGLAGVALAPDNGFADLALASLTKIFFVPLGAVIGGTIGWKTAWTGRSSGPPRRSRPR